MTWNTPHQERVETLRSINVDVHTGLGVMITGTTGRVRGERRT
jgi:hypothetical protein